MTRRKRTLIEFGWDEPDPGFMRAHVEEMEATPFDGCVFHISGAPGSKEEGFTWGCWGNKAFSWRDVEQGAVDLRRAPFRQFTENLLRFNVTPGDVDWFDDLSPVMTNARLASRVASEGGCLGICFDIEQYQSQLFDYSKQRHKGRKSWDEYAQEVRLHGRELMDAFQSHYPEITIFMTFGYSIPWHQMKKDNLELTEVSYGLLAPLLDGMVDAANQRSVIVDGYELAYPYKDTSKFAEGYEMMAKGVLGIVDDPEKYRRVFSLGFGIWLDCDWRTVGWQTDNLDANFYSPDEFEKTLAEALRTTDQYVWIYSEQPRWWTPSGGPKDLPQEYVDAVKQAPKHTAVE